MNAFRFKPLRILTAVTFSSILMTGFTISAHAEQDHSQQMHENWAQHRQQWIKARLAKMAERLEIKSSQQTAWQAFAKVVEEPLNAPMERPDPHADAATLAHHHADFATAYAKKMVQLADATAKLQEVLTPDQRITLNQIAHEFDHRGHARHHEEHEGNEDQGRPDNR